MVKAKRLLLSPLTAYEDEPWFVCAGCLRTLRNGERWARLYERRGQELHRVAFLCAACAAAWQGAA